MEVYQSSFYCENYQTSMPKGRRKFTQQEDDNLLFLIYKIGSHDWAKIAESMPGRTAKQCRDRYCNYLAVPQSNKPWDIEEDEQLLALLTKIGPKWVEISRHIPGRSGANVKNRWYRHLCKTYSYKKGCLFLASKNSENHTSPMPNEQSSNSESESLENIQKQYRISALLI
ncbi:hypothetical protein M9Y10_027150 [Tritrichomonas musculus]|uniref:Myb-like DNA-binding domain containing protein n=1 Tax=Tritrichomonas musculus TaxID=1915356 RepID=A0ABR2H5L8_9EUKA